MARSHYSGKVGRKSESWRLRYVQGLGLIFWHSSDEVTGELCETCDQVPTGGVLCVNRFPEIIETRPDGGSRLPHLSSDVNILPEVVGNLVKDLSR